MPNKAAMAAKIFFNVPGTIRKNDCSNSKIIQTKNPLQNEFF
jgi:hypothetical protein